MDTTPEFREGRAAFDDHKEFDTTWAIEVGVSCVVLTILVIIIIIIIKFVWSRRLYKSFTNSKEEGTVEDLQGAAAPVTPKNNSFTSLQWRFNARQVEAGPTSDETPQGDRKFCQSETSYDVQCSCRDNLSYSVEDDGYSSGNSRIHSGNDLANASSRSCWHLSKEDEPIYVNNTFLTLQYTMNDTLYDYPPGATRAMAQYPDVETHYNYPPSAIRPKEPVYDYPPSTTEPVCGYSQHKSTPGESIYDHPPRSPAPLRNEAVQDSVYYYPQPEESIYDHPQRSPAPVRSEVVQSSVYYCPQPEESIYDHPPRSPAPVRREAVQDPVYDYPQQNQNPHFMYYRPSPNTCTEQTGPDQSIYDRPPKFSAPVEQPRSEKY